METNPPQHEDGEQIHLTPIEHPETPVVNEQPSPPPVAEAPPTPAESLDAVMAAETAAATVVEPPAEADEDDELTAALEAEEDEDSDSEAEALGEDDVDIHKKPALTAEEKEALEEEERERAAEEKKIIEAARERIGQPIPWRGPDGKTVPLREFTPITMEYYSTMDNIYAGGQFTRVLLAIWVLRQSNFKLMRKLWRKNRLRDPKGAYIPMLDTALNWIEKTFPASYDIGKSAEDPHSAAGAYEEAFTRMAAAATKPADEDFDFEEAFTQMAAFGKKPADEEESEASSKKE